MIEGQDINEELSNKDIKIKEDLCALNEVKLYLNKALQKIHRLKSNENVNSTSEITNSSNDESRPDTTMSNIECPKIIEGINLKEELVRSNPEINEIVENGDTEKNLSSSDSDTDVELVYAILPNANVENNISINLDSDENSNSESDQITDHEPKPELNPELELQRYLQIMREPLKLNHKQDNCKTLSTPGEVWNHLKAPSSPIQNTIFYHRASLKVSASATVQKMFNLFESYNIKNVCDVSLIEKKRYKVAMVTFRDEESLNKAFQWNGKLTENGKNVYFKPYILPAVDCDSSMIEEATEVTSKTIESKLNCDEATPKGKQKRKQKQLNNRDSKKKC